ncbi:MAG: hypothetical protein D6710_09715 [Nitrospirae bacterium]|nr:MAG: hypothetical protein D6710_09715 [Nitrospirota bacterium]
MKNTAQLIKKLASFSRLHREIELTLFDYLKGIVPEGFIFKERKNPLGPGYIEKNIFSILFLSIYDSIGIPDRRQRLYGMLNHSVRGIVTSTDNILDRENKFMLPVRFGKEGFFPSIMHILLFDRLLYRVLIDAERDGLLSGISAIVVENTLFRALLEIGLEEAGEERGVDEIIKPQRVLAEVHTQKGGNLLRLAFVAPRLIETDKAIKDRLMLADRGVFSIGMALQCIDDITDIKIDLKDRRHNYLVSLIWHEGRKREKQGLEEMIESPDRVQNVSETFSQSVAQAVHYAITEAVRGFRILQGAGFWIDAEYAINLLKILFRLRGVSELVRFFPENPITEAGENPYYDQSFGVPLQ